MMLKTITEEDFEDMLDSVTKTPTNKIRSPTILIPLSYSKRRTETEKQEQQYNPPS